jgi:hypothetical protein
MALSTSRLSGSIRSKLVARAFMADGAELTALCDDIAQAVIEEITTNAVVPALGLLAPPGTAGGPVTGSAVVT